MKIINNWTVLLLLQKNKINILPKRREKTQKIVTLKVHDRNRDFNKYLHTSINFKLPSSSKIEHTYTHSKFIEENPSLYVLVFCKIKIF